MEFITQQILRPSRLVMAVLWPGFLMACVSCGALFSLIDPTDLVILGVKVDLSVQASYTLGFLLFWVLGCIASTITVVLLIKPR